MRYTKFCQKFQTACQTNKEILQVDAIKIMTYFGIINDRKRMFAHETVIYRWLNPFELQKI